MAFFTLLYLFVQELTNDCTQPADIFLVDFPNIADSERIRIRHLSRINGISPLLDIVIHLVKRKRMVFRVEEGGNDWSLMPAVNIRTNPHLSHQLNQQPVIGSIALMSGLNSALCFHLPHSLGKCQNHMGWGGKTPFPVLLHCLPLVI